jgi:hypothetical protein
VQVKSRDIPFQNNLFFCHLHKEGEKMDYNSNRPRQIAARYFNEETGPTGTVTSITTGTGLTGGPITTTGTISIDTTGVVAGVYTNANITVNAQGQITVAGSGTAPPVIVLDDLAVGNDYPETPQTEGVWYGSGTKGAGVFSSTRVGNNSSALPGNASAFGDTAVAGNVASSAFGAGSFASGPNSTAVGKDAQSAGSDSAAFGNTASSGGVSSLACGYVASAPGASGTAVGTAAAAAGANASAFGDRANAQGASSLACGQQAIASGVGGVCIGANSSAGLNGTAVGAGAAAQNAGAVCIGQGAQAVDGCIALGLFAAAAPHTGASEPLAISIAQGNGPAPDFTNPGAPTFPANPTNRLRVRVNGSNFCIWLYPAE